MVWSLCGHIFGKWSLCDHYVVIYGHYVVTFLSAKEFVVTKLVVIFGFIKDIFTNKHKDNKTVLLYTNIIKILIKTLY